MEKRILLQFFVEKKLQEEAIKKLLSDIFDTSRIKGLASNSTADILYEYQYYKGDFNTSVMCYVSSEVAKKKGINDDKGLGLLIAKALGEQVLISDEQISPYAWLLIEGDKIYEAKQIDNGENTMLIEKNVQVTSLSA